MIPRAACCLTCRRSVSRSDLEAPKRPHPEDFCPECARPISAKGEELADRAGCTAIAKNLTGRRPARPNYQARGNVPEEVL